MRRERRGQHASSYSLGPSSYKRAWLLGLVMAMPAFVASYVVHIGTGGAPDWPLSGAAFAMAVFLGAGLSQSYLVRRRIYRESRGRARTTGRTPEERA